MGSYSLLGAVVFLIEGENTTFIGKVTFPILKDAPAAITRPTPESDRFGPTPNSTPERVRKPSIPEALGRKSPC